MSYFYKQSRELKFKTGLQKAQITKSLKTLETRKLIKWIHTVSAKSRKVYLIYEIEPSRELTGGAWYSDNELDEDLIRVLHDQCALFIAKQGFVSAEQVYQFVCESGVFKVDLRVDDVITVLDTLIFDGIAEAIPAPTPGTGGSRGIVYRSTRMRHHPGVFCTAPCARCPVSASCAPGADVCPEMCPYISKWLEGKTDE